VDQGKTFQGRAERADEAKLNPRRKIEFQSNKKGEAIFDLAFYL